MNQTPTHRVVPLEGKYAVVVARREGPDWLKVIARFENLELADGYAELKNGYPKANPCRRWTDKEDKYLKLAWKLGLSPAGIAEQLKRTIDAIHARAAHLNLKARPRRKAEPKKAPTPSDKTGERMAKLDAVSRAALEHLDLIRATGAFDQPKTRRCQGCKEFFQCSRVEDIYCAECVRIVVNA